MRSAGEREINEGVSPESCSVLGSRIKESPQERVRWTPPRAVQRDFNRFAHFSVFLRVIALILVLGYRSKLRSVCIAAPAWPLTIDQARSSVSPISASLRMSRLTEELIRRKAEHHDGLLSDLEEISLHQVRESLRTQRARQVISPFHESLA